MSMPFLDCRDEVTAFRQTPVNRRAWLASEISSRDWVIPVSRAMLREVHALMAFIQANPLQNWQRNVEELSLPHCRETMGRMKQILDDGVGFAVLDRLPMDDGPVETLVEVYWLLGQYIGRPVAQKWNGQMIYDVRDTGTRFGYGVRGSHTSVELGFHTDNAFAKMVPDYVGLLCRYPSKKGGISRFCSLYTVHDRMYEQYPDALMRLYQPMYFDRQKEHCESAPKVSLAPFFSWSEERLNARANSSLVRKGYEVVGEPMDCALKKALDAIDTVCTSKDIWFEGPLERGQVQYLNNHEIGHYRSEFEDHPDPARRRHLYRLWHRERGTACYDGGRL